MHIYRQQYLLSAFMIFTNVLKIVNTHTFLFYYLQITW